ncbi:hypothetical protein FA95DRAFT_1471615, partial [Auriscalpium vulgare]
MLRASPHLQGYSIPGVEQRLIINLFADDTVLYLSAEDRYDTVHKILTSWCAASGAKFNIGKTEIIPIGSVAHRQRVITSRKLHTNDDTPINQSIHIAADGTAIRSLGAWIGNEINNAQPWEPTLDKIRSRLTQWLLGHPTIFGKRHVVQMVVGGMSQYLTRVQGMPRHIETAIVKEIRAFMWPDSARNAPIALKHLYRPRNEGGIGLLNVPARNAAIELT